MSIPAAKNGIDSYMMHYHRRKYVRLAYPRFDPRNAIDLWYGPKYRYGKIDEQENVVIVKDWVLKNLSMAPNIYLLNFVADAYEKFREYMIVAYSQGNITQSDTFLKQLIPVKGYQSPIEIQENFLEVFDEAFSQDYFSNNNKFKEVKDIFDYIRVFWEFFGRTAARTPITLSSIMTSRIAPPLVTGLVLELSVADHGDDATKYNGFIQDSNFNFYQNAARRFGFRVDYNAPWRLVADVASIEMRRFMSEYDITSYSHMFDNYYKKVSLTDTSTLKRYIFNSYNNFVERNPYTRIYTPGKEDLASYAKEELNNELGRDLEIPGSCFIDRLEVESEEYEGFFNDDYWLKFYFKVRSLEAGFSWSGQNFSKKLQYISRLGKIVDIYGVLDYIDKQFL